MLLERDDELQQGAALVGSVRAGQGGLLFVEGTAGAGKTSVLAALREDARREGVTVLSARGAQVEQGFGYGVVRQLLEPALAAADEARRATLLSGAAQHALLVLDAAPVLEQDGDAGLRALHGLHWFTVNLSDEQPLLLVVDDAHWADVASLRWLAYLLRRVDGLPVGLAVGARPEAPPDVVAVLDELADDPLAVVARPRPLSEEAIHALAAEQYGTEPEPEFVTAAARVSGGNPFFVGELLRSARDEGLLPAGRDAPRLEQIGPDRIARSVGRRVQALGSAAHEVAQAAAVLDGAPPAALVAAVAGRDLGEVRSAAAALARAGVLHAGEPLDFAHPILRTAIAERIDPARRLELHAAAAQALTEAGADLEQVAAHLSRLPAGYEAGPLAGEDLARALLDAARLAVRRGTPESSLDLLERALEERLGADLRTDILAAFGRAALLAHRPGGVARMREAMRCAPRPERRWQLALELTHQLLASGEDDVAVEVAEGTLAEPDLPDVVRQELEAEVWEAAAMDAGERMAERRRRLDERVERARAGEELHPMIAAPVAHRLVLSGRDVELGARLALGALADPRLFAAGVSGVVGGATHAVVLSPHRLQIMPLLDGSLAAAAEAGSDRNLIWGAAMRAMVLTATGELAKAEEDVRSILRLWSGHEEPGTIAWLLANIVHVLCARGLAEEADALLAERAPARPYPPRFPFAWLLHAQGLAALACGRPDDALAVLLACGDLVVDDEPMPDALPWRSTAAQCHLALGSRDQARSLAAVELERARAVGIDRATGRAATVLALCHEGEELRDGLEEAVELLESADAPVELARAQIELGAALRRAGRRIEARELLRVGIDRASTTGAVALADRAKEELLAAGARPQRERLGGPESLTVSERRVVDLAIEGSSNREIAQALFLTQKTVETHLSSAYRKLGIPSRAKLAAALAG